MLRQRGPKSTATPAKKPNSPISAPQDTPILSASGNSTARSAVDMADDPRRPLLGNAKSDGEAALSERHASSQPPSYNSYSSSAEPVIEGSEDAEMDLQNMSRKSQWIILAVASGACAAFNGVFAKLTTTELTTSFATGIANLIGLSNVEKGVEVVVRAIFFGLNLIFNGIMWALFTRALRLGTSTTQVSILNTSSNFMITALLGLIIFSESLPPLWFLGAALLVVGNVIIGRRDEGEDASKSSDGDDGLESGSGEGGYGGNGERRYTEGGDETGGLLGESVELDEDLELERKRRVEEEDILMLGSESEEEDGQAHEERLI